MTEKFQNPDFLLHEQTDRQLSTVDWDRLYQRIQKKLDAAPKRTLAVSIKSKRLRWAVGISAAAAILLIAFVLINESEESLPLPPGQRAAVALSEQNSIAKTEIEKPAASVSIHLSDAQAEIQFASSDGQVAQCEVTIVDQSGHPDNEDMPRPSWIIMTASKPASSADQTNSDQLDIACML